MTELFGWCLDAKHDACRIETCGLVCGCPCHDTTHPTTTDNDEER